MQDFGDTFSAVNGDGAPVRRFIAELLTVGTYLRTAFYHGGSKRELSLSHRFGLVQHSPLLAV